MPAETLLWDTPVQLTESGGVGGLAHYFNETAQALYTEDTAMATRIMATPEGQYSAPGDPREIQEDMAISGLRLDHPAFGILFASWIEDGALVAAIYVYAADISDIIETMEIIEQVDNPIKGLSLVLKNARADLSEHDMSLIVPGAAIDPYLAMGDSLPLPLGRYYLDTGPYDPLSDTLGCSGRSRVGRLLRDTTFDLYDSDWQAIFSGTPAQIVRTIIERASDGELAGDDIIVQDNANSYVARFAPSDGVLGGLLAWLEAYRSPGGGSYPDLEQGDSGPDVEYAQILLNNNRAPGQALLVVDGIFGSKTRAAVQAFQRAKKLPVTGVINTATWAALLGAEAAAEAWGMTELYDGRIIVGDAAFVGQYRPVGRYTFTRNADVITRVINRSLAGAYSRVGVRYQMPVGDDEQDAYAFAVVGTWPAWAVPDHRTYYVNAPEGATAAQAQALADTYAIAMQYAGIGEDVMGPIRPELLVGDIAQISDGGDTATVTGVITEVRHTLGVGGAFTSFSSDSGGTVMEVGDGEDVAIITTARGKPSGSNRRRRLSDSVRAVARAASNARVGLD